VEVFYKSNKLERQLTEPASIRRAYGTMAKAVHQRIQELKASDNLEIFMTLPAARCHELSGKLTGYFAATVSKNFRMIFSPRHNPLPLKPDKGIDLQKITSITILDIEDYH
jgi:plasmid maintenance system killer protein